MSNIFDESYFRGALVDQRDTRLDAEFLVCVNRSGDLSVRLPEIPKTPAVTEFFDRNFGSGRTLHLKLTGQNAGRESFSTTDFYVTNRRVSGVARSPTVSISGRCQEATISRPATSNVRQPIVEWFTNGFKTFLNLGADSEHGKVQMFGHLLWDKHEPPAAGRLALFQRDQQHDYMAIDAATLTLEHVARIMSVALDVYITPRVIVERREKKETFHIRGGVQSAQPYVPPFDRADIEKIFAHACGMTTVQRDHFKAHDLPIRWLVAPAHYEEARHIGAMTALEAVLEQQKSPRLVGRTEFERLKRKLAYLIKEQFPDQKVADQMCTKLNDLNRPSLGEKLRTYISHHDVPTDDFPPEFLDRVIRARNEVVHTGIGKDDHSDIVPYMHVARALVTRILLRAAGYRGPMRWIFDTEMKSTHL
ncbi:hypothetical protein [Paraburkholderia tropica]|uniref:hypothetical protein n=1 Tax=Paraburkholderia tropica TaxID=92647 RepID=UPI002AB7B2CB|nr:hypothetical protein [Paraburkholderia tropica]